MDFLTCQKKGVAAKKLAEHLEFEIFLVIQGDSIKAGPILKSFYLSHFLLKLNKLGLKINIKHLLIDSKNK